MKLADFHSTGRTNLHTNFGQGVRGAVETFGQKKNEKLNAAKLTEHADPVEVVQIAADVVPEPVTSPIEHHAVLFAVVIVRLLTTPLRFVDHVTRHPPPRP